MKKTRRTENKQLGLNMIANIVSYSANLAVLFVLTPFLINTLGKETYGFYPIANTIVMYMSVITNSMNTMASRFVTINLVNHDTSSANKYYSSVFIANTLLSLALAIPMAIIVIFLDSFMHIPINAVASIKILFLLIFSSALVNVFGSIYGIATFAKNRLDLRSLRELVTSALKLILFVLMYKYLPVSIVYVGIVSLVVALVNVVFQFCYTRALLPDLRVRMTDFSKSHVFELFSSSVWNMINSFGNALLTGMSLILANIFFGSAVSGTYSIVQTVPQFINGVISMLVGVFFPVVTARFARHDLNGLLHEINKAQKTLGIIAGATITVFSALASNFFALWTPSENSGYLSILSLVTIAPHIFIASIWTLTDLNIVMNKVKIPAIFTLMMGLANLSLAYVAFRWTNIGLISLPIISSLLQIVWIVVFIPQYACKNLKVKWNTFYGPLLRNLLAVLPITVLVLFLKQFVRLNTWPRFILFGALMGLIALITFTIISVGFRSFLSAIRNFLGKADELR